jgi:hypothetical protein
VGDQGDTAALLREVSGAEMVPIDEVSTIERRLAEFITILRKGQAPQADAEKIRKYSRRHGAELLAGVLDEAAA